MKRRGLLNKHLCEFFFSNIPIETEKMSFFTFPYQPEFLSGQNKNTIYVKANVHSMYDKFQLHPPYGF